MLAYIVGEADIAPDIAGAHGIAPPAGATPDGQADAEIMFPYECG